MSKLNYFTTNSGEDNTEVFLPKEDDFDEIVIGATCHHVVRLPFTKADTEYIALIKALDMFYRQDNLLFSVNLLAAGADLTYDDISYIAEITLLPEQTNMFKPNSLLDAFCQLQVVLADGTVSYDEPHKLKLITPINLEAN